MEVETIKSVTKGDINDLKAYANAIGVKCENCIYSTHYIDNEYFCEKLDMYFDDNEFCSRFEEKETND